MTTRADARVDPVVTVYVGDVDQEFHDAAVASGVVACDIETSGLDWRVERIATCQLHVPGHGSALVRFGVDSPPPPLLRALMNRPDVVKIFHHAMFDLRFMVHRWDTTPQTIMCTKIASKIASPHADAADHSLKPLVQRFLGAELDKSEQQSDWFAVTLTDRQLAYAVADVVHLPALAEALHKELRANAVEDLAARCFAHIPTRVELEVRGYGDPFTY